MWASEGTLSWGVWKIKVAVDGYNKGTCCEFLLVCRDVAFTSYLFFDEITVSAARDKVLLFNIVFKGCKVILNECFEH